jgi:hypothetical protein
MLTVNGLTRRLGPLGRSFIRSKMTKKRTSQTARKAATACTRSRGRPKADRVWDPALHAYVISGPAGKQGPGGEQGPAGEQVTGGSLLARGLRGLKGDKGDPASQTQELSDSSDDEPESSLGVIFLFPS